MGGEGWVTITRGGEERLLRHAIRHSPTGLSWGYAGSGPADLALSVLTDALGQRARCAVCAATGGWLTTSMTTAGTPRPL